MGRIGTNNNNDDQGSSELSSFRAQIRAELGNLSGLLEQSVQAHARTLNFSPLTPIIKLWADPLSPILQSRGFEPEPGLAPPLSTTTTEKLARPKNKSAAITTCFRLFLSKLTENETVVENYICLFLFILLFQNLSLDFST